MALETPPPFCGKSHVFFSIFSTPFLSQNCQLSNLRLILSKDRLKMNLSLCQSRFLQNVEKQQFACQVLHQEILIIFLLGIFRFKSLHLCAVTVCSFSRDIFFRIIGYPSTFPPSYSGKKAIVHLHRKVLTTFSIPLKSKIDSRKSLHNSLLLLLCLIIFAKLQTQDPFPVLAHWKIANQE